MSDNYIQVQDGIDSQDHAVVFPDHVSTSELHRPAILARIPIPSDNWPMPDEIFHLMVTVEGPVGPLQIFEGVTILESDLYDEHIASIADTEGLELSITPLRKVIQSQLPDDHGMTMVVRGAVFAPADVVPVGFYDSWRQAKENGA